MKFIPQSPGIVGFGGGNKPAVFQAIAPQYQLINQQAEDPEDVPVFCHDSFGDTLPVTVSGITSCDGCYTVHVPGDGGGAFYDFSVSWTGVNGSFDLIWDAIILGFWGAVIATGNITVQQFGSSDGTCTGLLAELTGDTTMLISCSGGNILDVGISGIVTGGVNSGGGSGWDGSLNVSFFINNSGGIDIPISNDYAACTVINDKTAPGGINGTVTIDV